MKKVKNPNAKQRLLSQQWEELKTRAQPNLELGAKSKAVKLATPKPSKIPRLVIPTERNPYTMASVDSGKGSTALPTTMQYTGTKMLGIGTLHKSNSIPIFNTEAAADVAKMRR